MRASLANLDPNFSRLRHLAALALGGGSGGGSIALPRFRFIARDTTQGGQDGSVGDPYKTIGQFDAAFAASASIADASAPVVAFITPAIGGYVENIVIPAYRQIEYRADNFGNFLTGNVSWANVAGVGTHVPTFGFAGIHNLSVLGTLAITDDAGAANSDFLLAADEVGQASAIVSGAITANTTQKLTNFSVLNYSIAAINLGTGAANAALNVLSGQLNGNASALGMVIVDSTINNGVAALTIGAGAGANSQFLGSRFIAGGNPVLAGGALATATFDGPTWRSFVEAGGTVTAGGVRVLIVGGYQGGALEGHDLTNDDVSVSLNGLAAGTTAAFAQGGNHYTLPDATLTGDHICKLLIGGGELTGDTVLITRTDKTAHLYTIQDDTTAAIAVLPVSVRGFVKARFNGAHWVMVECSAAT